MTSVEQEPTEASFRDVIRVDEAQVRSHVDQVVRATVEETLNGLLRRGGRRTVRGQALRAVAGAAGHAGRAITPASCRRRRAR